MTRRVQYFVGVTVIAPVWLGLSIWLTIMMAGAEDTMPLDLPVPLWLKLSFGVAVPVHYLLPDSLSLAWAMFAMLLNSILWGFVLVFFLRLVARKFGAKKREVTNAA